jgi:hypothetical protein
MNSAVVQTHYTNIQSKSTNVDEKNFVANCKHCVGKKISGNIGSSTNFIKHLKVSSIFAYSIVYLIFIVN